MQERKKLIKYFQDTANNFDAFYTHKKSFLLRFLDKLMRGSMRRRFILTMEECRDAQGKDILDIGCGSGRYSVAVAGLKARSVLGIDFSRNMLDLAKKTAREQGLSENCEFIEADFLEYDFKRKFDVCFAIGVFDYLKEPLPFLRKIRELTNEKALISFPRKWHLLTLSRKTRLSALGCPVYFYNLSRVKKLFEEGGFSDCGFKNLGRDYLVVAKP